MLGLTASQTKIKALWLYSTECFYFCFLFETADPIGKFAITIISDIIRNKVCHIRPKADMFVKAGLRNQQYQVF